MTKPESWRYLQPQQIERLRSVIGHLARKRAHTRRWPQALALVEIALHSALRPGELSRLNCGDIDKPLGVLYVKGSKCRADDHIDTILLSEPLIKAWNGYLDWKDDNGEGTELADPLFLNRQGERISGRSLARLWTHCCRASGLDREKHSLYVLRHSCLSSYYAATLDLYGTSELGRHRSPSTTMRYVHNNVVKQQQTREVLAALY